jgi:type I restriction enzyme S subunit
VSVLLSEHLPLLATAPNGIQKLRGLILELAVRGKLLPQDPDNEPASELLKRIAKERARLEAEGVCKKSKAMPQVGEDEQPFDVPLDWAWACLGQLAMMVTDGTHHTPTYLPSGVPFISVKDIDGSTVSFRDCRYISEAEHKQINQRCNPERGDMLLCRIGTLGRPTLVDTDSPFSLFVSVGLIKLPKSFDLSRYLHLVLSSPCLSAQYDEIKAGGSHTNKLNLGDIPTLRIPVPPLAEQHRIVAKVDELMALCDRLEAEQTDAERAHAKLVETLLRTLTQSTDTYELAANWQRLAEHFDTLFTTESSLDALKQTVLQLAVMGKLVPQDPNDEPASELLKKLPRTKTSLLDTEEDEQLFKIPFSWQWTRLGIVFSGGSGTTPSRARHDYFHGGTEHWVKTTDLNNDVVTTCEELITPSAVSDCNLKKYPPGTVCVAMYGGGGTIGKTGVLGISSTINQSVFALPPVDQVSSAFTHYYLKSIRGVWMKFAAGLRVAANINGQIIKNMVLPLPPLAEQHRIVAKVDELMALCDRLKADLGESRTRQSRLSATLIESALQVA